MSYADLLEEEGVSANYLAIIRPARKVTSWTSLSSSRYSASFDYGYVSSVEIDGVALTSVSTSSVLAGEFFWDDDTQTIYARALDSGNLNSKFVVLIYEIYVGTFDAHWYRVPTDSSTKTIYFEPLIARVPSIKTNVKDVAFGILPIQSSGIVLNNADKILNRHIYDGGFRGREILIYHWLDKLDEDNIKLVIRGRMDSLSWEDNKVSIRIFNSFDVFESEFRAPQGNSFYSSSDYPELDTRFEGKPIRYVYGVVDGFVPVNVDYLQEGATTSDNRVWKVSCDGLNQYQKSTTVPASPSSTTTRTYLTSAAGITVGDTVYINKTTDESRIVTAVNYTGNQYIEHSALSSGAAANGDIVERGSVARIDIIQQGVKFTALYKRDYTETVDANGVLGFTFVSGLESNLSMTSTLSPTDTVFCRVYGKQNNITLNALSYGSNDVETGNLTSLAPILFDLIKRFAGVPESQINIPSATTLLTDSPDRLSFAIPDNSNSKFPKIKNILSDICQTGLVSLFTDDDLKWTATRLKANQAVSGSIDNSELLAGSIDYDFDYSDIYSDVVVKYNSQEVSKNGLGDGYNLARASSNTARYLHKIDRTLEVDSLHYAATGAELLATRLADFYGDRQGTISFACKNRFFGFSVNEIIEVSRDSLPGFEFELDILRTINFNLRETDKTLRQVRMIGNDLKGVNDNAGDF